MPESIMPHKSLIFYTKLLFGIGILFFLVLKINWSELAFHAEQIAWPLFPVLIIMCLANRFMMAYKWNILLRANGIFLPNLHVLGLYLVSNFFGSFTPGNLGGDAYRILALAPPTKKAEVFSTVIIERAMGLLTLLLLVAISLPFSFALFGANANTVLFLVIGSISGILIILILPKISLVRRLTRTCLERLFKKRVPGKLIKIKEAFADQGRKKKILLFFMVLTFGETIFFFLRNYVAIHAVGIDISLTLVFMVMPLVHFLLRLPISIQGIGVQEGLFAYAMSIAGYDFEQGILISLLWRITEVFAVYMPAATILMVFPLKFKTNVGKH